jgi:hypothetical protein
MREPGHQIFADKHAEHGVAEIFELLIIDADFARGAIRRSGAVSKRPLKQLRLAEPVSERLFQFLQPNFMHRESVYFGASKLFWDFFLASSRPDLHCDCSGPAVEHFVNEAIASE